MATAAANDMFPAKQGQDHLLLMIASSLANYIILNTQES